jgi:hypothetical protein
MNIVITTINPPNAATKSINDALAKTNGTLWVVGDVPGPYEYNLSNVNFLPIQQQRELSFSLAKMLPERHYCRKNLGYLAAIERASPDFLLETDDDNFPYEAFFGSRQAEVKCDYIEGQGWSNVYALFTDKKIWPRGFPLEEINLNNNQQVSAGEEVTCYIQQALANDNPDVDAIYRLTSELPLTFDKRDPVALGEGVWCPFNSQATTFFRPAFPLLYLPSYCSFRMTDIWRSFIAQRCLWAMGSSLLFTEAFVYQERNEHNLMKDFKDEVPGYLENNRIVSILSGLSLKSGTAVDVVCENLTACYAALVKADVFPAKEISLVAAWASDLTRLLG